MKREALTWQPAVWPSLSHGPAGLKAPWGLLGWERRLREGTVGERTRRLGWVQSQVPCGSGSTMGPTTGCLKAVTVFTIF